MKIKKTYISLPVQVKASLWFFVCLVLQKGITIITTPIFTRLMSTKEYGQYNVFNSWLNIITVFASLCMYNAVYTQSLIKFDKERDELSSSLQGLTTVLVGGWSILYLATKSFWNNLFQLTTVQMIAMMFMIWATSIFHFWAAEQRVNLTYRKLVILTLLVSIMKPIVGILLVRNAVDKVTARIWGLTIVELLGYTGLFFIHLKKSKKLYSKKFWKYSLLFCIPLIPHYLSQTILNGADKIMIQRMVGDSEAGIYSLAYSLSQLMLMVNQSLLQTVNPWIYQKIKDRKEHEISKIAIPCLAIIGIMNVFLICFAPEIVAFFAPASYYDAIWIIPPVALSGYFIFAYSLFANFEFYYEKKGFITIATVISAGLNIILNYICIRIWGYYAAGYTTLACYIIYAIGHYFFMRRIVRDNLDGTDVYNIKLLIGMTIAFMSISILILCSYRYRVLRFSIIIIFMIVIFIYRKKIMFILRNIISTRKK